MFIWHFFKVIYQVTYAYVPLTLLSIFSSPYFDMKWHIFLSLRIISVRLFFNQKNLKNLFLKKKVEFLFSVDNLFFLSSSVQCFLKIVRQNTPFTLFHHSSRQFHQHFMRAFFVRKSFVQLFSSYSSALRLFGTRIWAQMLVKLTPTINFTNILQAAFSSIFFCQKNYEVKL